MERILQNFSDYLMHVRRLSDHTVVAYVGDVKQFLCFLIENDIELKDVSRLHIEEYIKKLSKQKTKLNSTSGQKDIIVEKLLQLSSVNIY